MQLVLKSIKTKSINAKYFSVSADLPFMSNKEKK